MKTSKNKLFIPLIAVFSFSLLFFLFFSEKGNISELKVANITSESLSVSGIYSSEKSRISPSAIVLVDSRRTPKCEDTDAGALCYSEYLGNDSFIYAQINNLNPSSEYEIRIGDTWSSVLGLKKPDNSIQIETLSLSDSIPNVERVYGRIIDVNEDPVSGSLVYIENDTDKLGAFSAVTGDNGTYSINYSEKGEEIFFQEVSVIAKDGATASYSTASFYNKPVADIIVGDDSGEILGATDETSASLLVSEANAANSCITDTTMGGIKAQCNDRIDWTENLSTSDCPAEENRFRLGVIKHTTSTSFHKTRTIKLKLYDPEKKEYVQDPATEDDLLVKNGGYVDMDKIELEKGKTYDIEAFDGSKSCVNTDGPNPSVTISAPAKPGSGDNGGDSGSGNDSGSSGGGSNLPPISAEANLCRKVGENFAIPYSVPVETMQEAVSMQMRWGEALITDVNDMNAYTKSVSDANNVGLNMILRICYKGNCNINSGADYGHKIIDSYNQLAAAGALPQDGLFVHVGHNEPNNAEYRDPQSEAQFVVDTVRVIDAAGLLSTDASDIKIKAIGPNLDLYRSTDGHWGGCDDCNDPNAHPISTAQTYMDQMLQNSSFSGSTDKIYSWAVNDYLDANAGGADKVVNDVNNFTSYLSSKGLTTNIMITELGNYGPGPSFTPSFPWSDLANTIATLDAMDNVQAILLFDSLGGNTDPNYAYHSDLWNNKDLLKSLSQNCEIGTFTVGQEGSVPINYEISSGSSSSGAPGGGSLGVTGGSASSNIYGGSFNGNDPCLGNICVGSSYGDYSVADGGLLNGNFEGEHVNDGADELKVPKFWHSWYQNGCQASACGSYSCTSDPTVCRRPEYKQSTGFGNRTYSGESSTQYFTSYGTHYAGLYQHIDIGKGDSTKLTFSASGSSWSDDVKCKSKDGQCVQEDGCHCEIINTFKGRIGIDPTGGIDPNSGAVVWTDWQSLPNVQPSGGSEFTQFELTDITTNSERVTVFLAANNEYPYRNSDAYWDAAELKVNGEVAIGDAASNLNGKSYSTSDEEAACDGSEAAGPNGESCWVDSSNAIQSNPTSVNITAQNTESSSEFSTVLGSVSNSSSYITLPGKGEYEITSDNLEFGRTTISNFEDQPLQVPVFQDANGNGVHDDNEYYVPTVSDVHVNKVGEVMELDLKPGLSIISMPLYTDEFDEAVDLVEEILNQDGYVTSISTYRNIGSQPGWDVYNQRGNQSYSDSFEIQPGDALYIAVEKGIQLKMRGTNYTSPLQRYLKQGWNLMSIKGSGTDYTSAQLLAEINQLPGVTATTVSVWNSEKGRYETYVADDMGGEFGVPLELSDDIGIFVYVEEGVGYWAPDGY